MRRFLLFFVLMITGIGMIFAQSGQKLSYQAVIRNSANQLVTNTQLEVTIGIANSENGAAVYTEHHTVTTNANGLISLMIGTGDNRTGNWDQIEWDHAYVTTNTVVDGVPVSHRVELTAVAHAFYADNVDEESITEVLSDHGIVDGAEPNVQGDWNQENTGADDYIKNKPNFSNVAISGNYNDLTNKPDLNQYATNEHLNDTLQNYLTIDGLCDSIKNCEVITNLQNADSLLGLRITRDSILSYKADSILAARFTADSILSYKSDLILSARITHDSILSYKADSVLAARLIDTARNIREDFPKVSDKTIILKQGNDTIGTFTLNQENDYTLTIPTPPDAQVQSDWNQTTTTAKDYIKHKPNIRDSVNVVMLDSLAAANSEINHIVDSIALNNSKVIVRDSLKLIRAKIYSDSVVLAKHISDSTRMVFDTLHTYYATKDTLNRYLDSAQVRKTIHDSIGNGVLTIAYGTVDSVKFTANQKTNGRITIPAQVNADWNATSGVAEIKNKPEIPMVNDATLTVQKNGTTVGTFTANQAGDATINITVPTCDSLAECDLIISILARLDKLERQNDSLARELEKLKPFLTVAASQDTVNVCAGSTKPVTYKATFHNCNSSEYTIGWKVNGTDSSNVTGTTLVFNAETAGDYEVVCVATRSGNVTVTDTVTTTVKVDNVIPSFDTTVHNLAVTLSHIMNTATIQWDKDSVPIPFSGTSTDTTYIYSVADTVTITALSVRGCMLSKQVVLQPTTPEVTTVSIPTETITATTAKVNCNLNSDGGIPTTRRGVLYSVSNSNPRLGAADVDSVMNGTGMGEFVCNLRRLVPCSQYHVCAFAINDLDTVYGEVLHFSTPSFTCGSTLYDIDGNDYATLLLGSQCWMKQNLRVTHYANGDTILLSTSTVGTTSPYRYEPDSNLTTYGYLYNWYAAMGGSSSSATNPSNVQGVCPDGWHLPSDAEWTQLTDFVSSYDNGVYVCGSDPTNIGKSMVSQQGWPEISGEGCNIGNTVATNNSTQFSIPSAGTWDCGGGVGTNGVGYSNNGHAIFLSATENDDPTYSVHCREFYYMESIAEKTAPHKTFGRSVRCVLDCVAGHTYLPTVSAVKITNTGGTISLTANVDSDGGANVTGRGVCWSTSQHPTISSAHTTSGSGIGEFSVTSTLSPGTTYYVRAYATNSVGTSYGAEVTIVIPNPPTVTTAAVSDITSNTAISGGEVTDEGDANVTARGVCWNTTGNPTVSDSHTTDGDGTGIFISNITGLTAKTTYYVRAYATNSGGTSYGSEVSFTTTDVVPMVTTSAVSDINGTTSITATCGGNVTEQGVSAVTARGVCWGTSQNLTIDSSHTTDGSGLGIFNSNITGLTAGATYYVRAYATNSAGTAYGDIVSFTIPLIDAKSCPAAPTVTDHEGNVYATVQMGDYCWMRENLRTTTSPKTGTYLVNTENKTSTNRSSYLGSKVAHWIYNNPTEFAPKGYGLLYNWCAAMDTANPENYVEVPTPSNSGNNTAFSVTFTGNYRGICPVGWHLPTFTELNYLKNNYTNSDLLANDDVWSGSPSNSSGFTARPAGFFGNGYSSFQGDGTSNKTYFWSCTNGTQAQSLYLTNSQKNTGNMDKNYGMSVRCVRD